MKSRSLFVLAAAIVVLAAPAAAWEPEIVGLDGPAPIATQPSAVADYTPPGPQPEVVGYAYGEVPSEAGESAAAEVRLAPLDAVHQAEPADPIAFATPTPVDARR